MVISVFIFELLFLKKSVLINPHFMQHHMTWEKICKSYPNEWVVVVEYERKGPVEVDGVVVAHGIQKSDLSGLVSQAMQKHGQAAVRYTGELIRESELPLLWQIFPID